LLYRFCQPSFGERQACSFLEQEQATNRNSALTEIMTGIETAAAMEQRSIDKEISIDTESG